ncbi:MAG: universal stress protein [Bacteroidales bacterium]|nr:universal stress protein [Bacteroidales bacterium]
MKRILVPVDFSPHTDISCQYALVIAKATGAEITLFYSFFDQLYFSDGGFNTGFESGIMLTDEIILDFHQQKESRLKEMADELNSNLSRSGFSKVKVNYQMGSGDPEVQILQAIQQLDPDLIIMGSSGMGKKRLLSGSVARRIIDNTKIPVIAVPGLEETPSISNVAYMTTFDPADCDAILEIDTVLSPFHVNIFCLHLLKDDDNVEAKQEIKNLTENHTLKKLEGRISFHILDNNRQQETLGNFLEEHKIDLIAFIPHKRNILKNIFYQGITKEDLFLTRIPIMAVRPIQ